MCNKLMAIKDLISKDNQIEVSANHLNKVIQMDQMYYKKLSEIGVENLNIEIEPNVMIRVQFFPSPTLFD
ncbi:MAG: hypothetical protein SRB2_00151 [Desulfobacteraceae bacterium Eth-SRB2]|nr:MAG: hypothetical protein SRB2_00151 [Desulfobacteraceae bacterium Eth-SRB2]